MTMPTMLMQRAHDEAVGDHAPELPDKPKRRTFPADYKLRIVAEYDACAGDGDKGALLRREGLYSSHIVEEGYPSEYTRSLPESIQVAKLVMSSTRPDRSIANVSTI